MIGIILDHIADPWGWFETSKQGNLYYRAFKSIEFTRNYQTWWLESISMMLTIISDPIISPWGWFELSKWGNLFYGAFKSIEFARKCQIWWMESRGIVTTIICDLFQTPGLISNDCSHHTYWFQSSHLIFSCKFYAFKSSIAQISLFGKFKSTPGTCNRIRNYCGHHTY